MNTFYHECNKCKGKWITQYQSLVHLCQDSTEKRILFTIEEYRRTTNTQHTEAKLKIRLDPYPFNDSTYEATIGCCNCLWEIKGIQRKEIARYFKEHWKCPSPECSKIFTLPLLKTLDLLWDKRHDPTIIRITEQ